MIKVCGTQLLPTLIGICIYAFISGLSFLLTNKDAANNSSSAAQLYHRIDPSFSAATTNNNKNGATLLSPTDAVALTKQKIYYYRNHTTKNAAAGIAGGVARECLQFSRKPITNQNRQEFLQQFDESECGALWNAKPLGPAQFEHRLDNKNGMQQQNIQIVVAYCTESLDWLWEQLQELTHHGPIRHNVNVTIFSKCNQAKQLKHLLVNNDNNKNNNNPTSSPTHPPVTIERLPNVGGCDHAYAYWMHRRAIESKADYIFFLKDTERSDKKLRILGNYRNFTEMLRIASINGFACGLDTSLPVGHAYSGRVQGKTIGCELMSVFHESSTWKKFNMKHHTYQRVSGDTVAGTTAEKVGEVPFASPTWPTLGDFIKVGAMQHHLNRRLFIPVCYGGTFAVKRDQILALPATTYDKMEKALARGNNIEEGHFAERMWAGLLSRELTPVERQALQAFHLEVRDEAIAVHGALIKPIQKC